MLAEPVVLHCSHICRLSSLDTIACRAVVQGSALPSQSRTRLRQHLLQVAAQRTVVAAPVLVTILVVTAQAQVAQVVCKIALAPAQSLAFGRLGCAWLREPTWLGHLKRGVCLMIEVSTWCCTRTLVSLTTPDGVP